MSLVSNEGDSEQNEIRNLQEKLESTMSLVRQLSGQLAELKEQVSVLGAVELGGVGWPNTVWETWSLLGTTMLLVKERLRPVNLHLSLLGQNIFQELG